MKGFYMKKLQRYTNVIIKFHYSLVSCHANKNRK